jgi:hypothetical protein
MKNEMINKLIDADNAYIAAVALKSAEVGIKNRLAAVYKAETAIQIAAKEIFAAIDSGKITVEEFGAENAQIVDDIMTKRGIQIL